MVSDLFKVKKKKNDNKCFAEVSVFEQCKCKCKCVCNVCMYT